MNTEAFLVECPRDAMQGLADFIPTDQKIAYLHALLQVGFSTLDCGSFVSPKAIPQMRDTAEVLAQLPARPATELLVIVANTRGAEQAVQHANVSWLGFPLSLSETFQQRNTNKSINEAFSTLQTIQNLATEARKKVVCYISMAFGNPYGDAYSSAEVAHLTQRIADLGIETVSLADTIGSANELAIQTVFGNVKQQFPALEVGLHLHSRPQEVFKKTLAAWQAGCRRIDGALRGFGGCPMAHDDLVGNMAMETIIQALESQNVPTGINGAALAKALQLSATTFPPA